MVIEIEFLMVFYEYWLEGMVIGFYLGFKMIFNEVIMIYLFICFFWAYECFWSYVVYVKEVEVSLMCYFLIILSNWFVG